MLFSSVDGENDAIWKRRRHQNRHDRAPDHSTASIQNGGRTMWLQFRANSPGRYIKMRMHRVHLSMRTEGIKAFSKQMRRCSVEGRKRYGNDKCGRKSFWKRSKTAPFSFENGLVWTEPWHYYIIALSSSSSSFFSSVSSRFIYFVIFSKKKKHD